MLARFLVAAALLVSSSGCLCSATHSLHVGVSSVEFERFEARVDAVSVDGVTLALDARSCHDPAGVWALASGEPFSRHVDEQLDCREEWLHGAAAPEIAAPTLPGDRVLAHYVAEERFARIRELYLVKHDETGVFLVLGATGWQRVAADRFRYRDEQPERRALWAVPLAPLYAIAAVGDVVTAPVQLGVYLVASAGNLDRH